MTGTMAQPAADSQTLGTGKLILGIAAFVALGIPLVAYIWETVNRVLSGHFETRRVLLTLPAILLLLGVFRLLSRTLTRWDKGT